MSRVVIVDDVLANGQLLESIIGVIPNLEVTTFTCPVEALAWCSTGEPDLVLLDYVMPDMDGVEFLRRFRSVKGLKDVPVVMVTGEVSREALYQALYAGATDFLRKPIDRTELIARSRIMLELRNRQRDLVNANERLYVMATTDALTGLRNRRFFLDALQQEIARSRRSERPLSVLAIDVDHFKAVNDDYGHDIGDKVLQALSRTILEEIRCADRTGRIGGEEFAVLLPDLAESDALKVCNRLLTRVRSTKINAGGNEITCTISIGLAEGTKDDDSVSSLLKRADSALYWAKERGRDRVEIAEMTTSNSSK
jgi:diguanylate cyclase (GGDEF)-like protein